MPKKQTTFSPDMLIALSRRSGAALRVQLADSLRDSIRSGQLAAGVCLPASRQLAQDLGVSRSVVVDAYAQLSAEGYLEAQLRSGTRVASIVAVEHQTPPMPATASLPLYDFRPGMPDPALFPRSAWASATRQILQVVPDAALAYGDPHGVPFLRQELASYLGRVRGVLVQPDNLMLCTGFAQGLGLVCRVLRARGVCEVAVEDPLHPGQCELIKHAGLAVVPIPVDEEGLCVAALEACDARAVLITPAHQFPTGVVLSPARRSMLLHWGRTREAVIIEDDYDAEYRYDRAPIGALQGLDPERVIYAGSASKMFTPALRMGWMALPPSLLAEVVAEKQQADLGSSALDQLIFAQMLINGHVDRHLRRVRLLYRQRRDALAQALAQELPQARISGIAAGLHAVVLLPGALSEAAVIREAEALGVRVYGLQSYTMSANQRPPALVLGYGILSETSIRSGISLLSEAVARAGSTYT
jgi:GntR family transcriptional regulator/MocR family aminotransferase